MSDPYFPQPQRRVAPMQKPVAPDNNPLRAIWERMLGPARRSDESFRQAIPPSPVTRPNVIGSEIDRTGSASSFAQELPIPTRVAPSPAQRATMTRRGRARAADQNFQERYGPGADAVMRHMTQEEREAQGTPRAQLPREASAILDVISEFEGTNRYPNRGYNTIVGGGQHADLSRHPRITGVRTADGPSAAFGRYQFIPGTWDMAARALGLNDVSPESQDRAAWWLAQRAYRGVTGRELSSDVQDPNRWDTIAAALGTEWASFPGHLGRNQRQHDTATFRQRLEAALGTAASQQPREASEFLGLSRGYRASPRAGQGRRFEDFIGRNRPNSRRNPEGR